MKSLEAVSYLSYTNDVADVQFSRQLVQAQMEMTAKRLCGEQSLRIHEAVKAAAASGAQGLKITWSAPKIEVVK